MNLTAEELLKALSGELPSEDVTRLTGELRSLPSSSVLEVAAQSGIRVTGDGNIIGNNNVSVVVKGEGAAELANELRKALMKGQALHQLPLPPSDFTGRDDELNELRALMKGGSVTIFSLHGMGGVGKTALALKLADEFKDDYPDGQIYLDLKGVGRRSESGLRQEPLTVVDVMNHVIHAWHPEEKLPDLETELAGRYRSVLADKRALLLFDNARNAAQLTPLIPGNRQCLLLVTSRQRFALGGREPYDIDKLKPEDAVNLLRHNSSRLSEQDAKKVAEICDYLPMALKPAVGLLGNSRRLTPEELIEKLRNKKRLLSLKDAERKDELLNISIEASFQLSYELLAEDEISDLPQRWRALAAFPDTFDEAAAAAVWALDVDAAREVLDALDSYSLVEITKVRDTKVSRYGLHDLARVFADSRMSEAERGDGRRLHARHYQSVLSTAEDLYLQGSNEVLRGLGLFDLERANIEAGQGWAAEQTDNDEVAAKLCVTYPDSGACVLDLRQHPHERIRWLEAMLTAARRLKRRDAECRALGNLGIAYAALGESRRAIEFYEQVLQIARETGDRRGEGNMLGNLGLAYVDLGETRRAIEFYEQVLQIARETGDRRGEGQALGNLGIAYAALGETRRAIEFYEQRLVIARETGDRRGEGNALGNLGIAYKNLGETRRAIEFYEQHLVIARETGDRRGEGNALWNMALALDQLEDRAQAMIHAEAALAIYEQIELPHAELVRNELAKWKAGDGADQR
jgi:tetratricopeptide (TPR) repeat protein